MEGTVYARIRTLFQPFGNHEIFPQSTDVIPGVEQIVLADNRVACPIFGIFRLL